MNQGIELKGREAVEQKALPLWLNCEMHHPAGSAVLLIAAPLSQLGHEGKMGVTRFITNTHDP